MKEDQFIQKYTGQWSELEQRAKTLEKKGLKRIGTEGAEAFHQAFRTVSHHLAYSRTHYPNSPVTSYLNSLLGRCQNHIYAVRKAAPEELIAYLRSGFARLVLAEKRVMLLAFGIFMLGALTAAGAVALNPDNARFFMPADFVESIRSGQLGPGEQPDYALMSSVIMTNNIGVSLKAFVFGITFGLLTGYILFFNGAMLGALAALVYQFADPLRFWSLILPHGVLELTAIFISGGAGLLIARGMLLPGELTRRDATVRGAKLAVSLMMGVVVMLVAAGLIEGFFTPLDISPWVKLAVAGLTAVFLCFWLRRR